MADRAKVKQASPAFSVGDKIEGYIQGKSQLGYEDFVSFFYHKHFWYITFTDKETFKETIVAVYDSYEAAHQDFHSRTEA